MLGYLQFNSNAALQAINKEFFKIIYLKKNAKVIVDFAEIECKSNTLFFINGNRFFKIINGNSFVEGLMLHYDADFYCVKIHDKEVSCDGILFNNVFEIPYIPLSEADSIVIENIFSEVKAEIQNGGLASEEMHRILLVNLIIKSTRIFTKENTGKWEEKYKDNVNFLRNFSQLVEQHFYSKKSVSDYAELLNISPKNLNKKIVALSNKPPNQIIKDRIVLEAKRLLAHTDLTSKEIAYKLGYEDDAYFTRFFSNQVALSPIQFRKSYQI